MGRLVLSMVFIASGVQPANSAPSFDTEGGKLADFVVAGIKDSRDRLKSGVFRARGRLDESARSEYPVDGEIDIFCAFDFDKGALRFDRLEPTWWAPAKSSRAAGEPQAAKLVQDGGRLVHLRDRRVQWRVREKTAWIRGAQEKARSITRPFDIRVIGLMNWAGLDFGVSWQDTLRFVQSLPHHAAAETDSIYRLVLVDQENEARLALLLDAKKGFSAVRLEQWEGPANSTGDWGEPTEVGETSWAKKNGVWVPTAFYQEVRRPVRKRRELSIEWESVNEPVDEALFTWQGMGLPEGTLVVDERLGKPIKVAAVGVREFSDAAHLPGGAWGWFRWLMVAFTVTVVILFVAWLFLRKRFGRASA